MPSKIMLECILPEWLEMEQDLCAFKTGDRSILLRRALESHQTRSYDQGVAVFEELLSAEGNEEMNAYYRFPSTWQ